jgi:hypothetical protein
VPGPVARYTSSRSYAWFALVALACAIATVGIALRWPVTSIATGLFLIPAIAFGVLALRPKIEIHETHLLVGRRAIAWREIRRVDQAHWHRRQQVPLAVNLTLDGEAQVLLIYAGSPESGRSLLRHLRRYSHRALLDGIPHRQYWGELMPEKAVSQRRELVAPVASVTPTVVAPAKAPLLLPEDEAEVERLFQQLKSAGLLGSSAPTDRDTPSLPQ